MQDAARSGAIARFGPYEVDLKARELRRNGIKIRLQPQPFEILSLLLERPGDIVTRDEIQRRLWPEGTFVEYEHSVATAVKKLRQALGDDSEKARYVQTLPRRGYRFVEPVTTTSEITEADTRTVLGNAVDAPSPTKRWRTPFLWLTLSLVSAIVLALLFVNWRRDSGFERREPSITRLTFDAGLQFEPTWSPDGRMLAYSSDRNGKFDIWVQQVEETRGIKITTRPGQNWQPSWSPDGSHIVFRSESEGGGLFVVPALGGPDRKVSSFGYRPRWSPRGNRILFESTSMSWLWNRVYVVALDGSPPREILNDFFMKLGFRGRVLNWYPDGERVSVWLRDSFFTVPLNGGSAVQSQIPADILERISHLGSEGGTPSEVEFCWDTSGRFIYLAASTDTVSNLWRIGVDPANLRWTSLQRLSLGPGRHVHPALSSDGKNLAFAAITDGIRVWSYPLDQRQGKITGDGRPITSPGVDAWSPDLSRNGGTLVYLARRGQKWEIWKQSTADGHEALLTSNQHGFIGPRLSPDGMQLLYIEWKPASLGGGDNFVTRTDEFSPKPVVSHGNQMGLEDWFPDGHALLGVEEDWTGQHPIQSHSTADVSRVFEVPLSASPHAETAARKIGSSGDIVGHARCSPDGRWIAIELVGRPAANNPVLYVLSTATGAWTPITDGSSWDDKPRWSPDGGIIYFASTRTGLMNIWAVCFHPKSRPPIGRAFPVTDFRAPTFTPADRNLTLFGFAVSENRLAISMSETSGSIWNLQLDPPTAGLR